MATAATIISSAFQKIRIDSPTSAHNTAALISLNNLISLEGTDFMFPYVVEESHTLTAADYEYTIGSGGNLDTVRPDLLLDCYLRDTDGYDYPLKILSKTDYARKVNKDKTGRPEGVYFLPEYPLAKVFFDYAPDIAYTAYFNFQKNFTEFATSATDVSLPNGYKEYLTYLLAISLSEDFDRVVPKSLYVRAQESKAVIDRLNAATKQVPKARFETVKIEDAPTYSITSDEYLDGGSF